MFIHCGIYFFIFVTVSVLAWNCPKNGICLCLSKLSGNNQTNCNTANNSVNIVILQGYATIICYDDWEWSYFNQEFLADNEIHKITFYMCDLPNNSSLGDIARKLGAVGAEDLSFKSSKNLGSMKRKHLKGLENLRYLYLSSDKYHNESQVDNDLLAKLTNLIELSIQHISLHRVTGFFNYTPNLSLLQLIQTNLQTIKSDTFDNLKHLKTLMLRQNNLVELQSRVFDELTTLTYLDLSSNNLIGLPEHIFGKLENLEHLDLVENQFAHLPRALLRNNRKLKTVRLFSNNGNMTTFPNGFFGYLTELTILELQENRLVTLPEDLIWGSTSLNRLLLSQNHLKSLPANIFRDSKKLVELHLSSNNFEELPDSIFFNLSELKELDLSGNRFSSISIYIFAKLLKLEKLYMARNHLTTIPDESFRSLMELKVAVFANNRLTLQPNLSNPHINEDERQSPFYHCFKLKELHLSNNYISKIFSDWMFNNQLRILDLAHNNISVINSKDLQFAAYDVTVNLSDNNIQHILLSNSKQLLKHQENPRNVKILIENNPINCDCELYDFLRYIKGKIYPPHEMSVHITPNNLTCQNPEELRNVLVKNLRSETLKCDAKGTYFNIKCLEKCDCDLKLASKRFLCDCSRKNLTRVPSDTKATLDNFWQIELNFSSNLLTQMPNLTELKLRSLTKLILSHNSISEVFLDRLSETVQALELHNNISKVFSHVLEFLANSMDLSRLTLHDNPWICDCGAVNFSNIIKAKSNIMPEKFSVVCRETNGLILKMDEFSVCPYNYIVFRFEIAFAIVFICGLLYYKYQRQIKVWLFNRNWINRGRIRFTQSSNEEKMYDVFVTYALEDEDFVVNELKNKLESSPMFFKLYLHQVDSRAATSANIITSLMKDCRQSILVVSSNFLEIIWEGMHFRTIYSRALRDNHLKLTVILYGDVGTMDELDRKLKEHMNVDYYIEWEDPLFSMKIRNALKHEFEVARCGVTFSFDSSTA